MPLAFVRDGDGFQLVALLSCESGHNLFVRPDGAWLPGAYVPAVLRTYPFQYLRHASDDRMALGFDEESGLVVPAGGEAPLFEADGQLSSSLTQLVGMLDFQEKSRLATAAAIATLTGAGVIVPWDVKIPVGSETRAMSSLFKIDELRLHRLDDDVFLRLRKAGSLAVAYGQLISMVGIDVLSRLAMRRAAELSNGRRFTLADSLTHQTDDILRFD